MIGETKLLIHNLGEGLEEHVFLVDELLAGHRGTRQRAHQLDLGMEVMLVAGEMGMR